MSWGNSVERRSGKSIRNECCVKETHPSKMPKRNHVGHLLILTALLNTFLLQIHSSFSTVAPVRPSHLFDSGGLEKNFRAFGPDFFFLGKFLGPVPQRRAPTGTLDSALDSTLASTLDSTLDLTLHSTSDSTSLLRNVIKVPRDQTINRIRYKL